MFGTSFAGKYLFKNSLSGYGSSASLGLGGVGAAAGGEVGDDEGGGDDQHFDFLSFVGVCSVTHFLALL